MTEENHEIPGEIQTPTVPEADESPKPENADKKLASNLVRLLMVFTNRQRELLRLGDYVAEREEEINSAKERAMTFLRRELNNSDEAVEEHIDRILENLRATDDLGGGKISRTERLEAINKAVAELNETIPDGAASAYLAAIHDANREPPGIGMLMGSLLVSLVGEFETFIGHVARTSFRHKPEVVGDSDRSFTWSEISSHQDLDDLREKVIDRTTHSMLQGSYTDWLDTLEKKFKIKVTDSARSFDSIEVFQRRHCMVHNAGHPSRQYFDNLTAVDSKKKIPEDLTVDERYLGSAADRLFLAAYSIVWGLGLKLIQDREVKREFTGSLANTVYVALQDERFNLVCDVYSVAPVKSLESDLTQLTFRVNYWLAHKLRGTFDRVRPEVEAMSLEGRSDHFLLAKVALLDDDDAALAVAHRMIESGELLQEYLATWPLLAGARRHARNL